MGGGGGGGGDRSDFLGDGGYPSPPFCMKHCTAECYSIVVAKSRPPKIDRGEGATKISGYALK